jgi:hypothetical protein
MLKAALSEQARVLSRSTRLDSVDTQRVFALARQVEHTIGEEFPNYLKTRIKSLANT